MDQIRVIEAVARWYLETHFGTASDPGVTAMFCDPARVGAFAVDRAALARHDADALFRLLVTISMFQRRQDRQITAVLRGISAADAYELTSAPRLTTLAEESGCQYGLSVSSLRERCDLTKDKRSKLGVCSASPRTPCALKRHTVLLKRYGHFGKVPTSSALNIREGGAEDLADLLERTRRSNRGATARAVALVAVLSRAWRVSEKISAMFLSIVANPDLTPEARAWPDVDWRHFIPIDSNVDLFLSAIGYRGARSYDARREFIRAASAAIDLRRVRPGLRKDNPRLIQQAMYLFMSVSNRRGIAGDCMHGAPTTCDVCPRAVARMCPARPGRRLPMARSSA